MEKSGLRPGPFPGRFSYNRAPRFRYRAEYAAGRFPPQPAPTPAPDTPYDPPQVPTPGPSPEIPGNTPAEAPGIQPPEIPVNDPGSQPISPLGPANPTA